MRIWFAPLAFSLVAGCSEGEARSIRYGEGKEIRFEVDRSGMRATELDPEALESARSIIFAGHLRGDGKLVSAEFMDAFPRLGKRAEHLVLLGDLTWNTTGKEYTDFVKKNIIDPFPGEVFVAPGNHDVGDRKILCDLLGGPTYRRAVVCDGVVALVVLDTELDAAGITGHQLEFFQETVRWISANEAIDFVFFCFHKFIWFPGNHYFHRFFRSTTNYGSSAVLETIYTPTNFWEELFPSMKSLAREGRTVFVIGGDFGFYAKSMHAEFAGIQFMGTGMGRPGSGNTYLHFGLSGRKLICAEKPF